MRNDSDVIVMSQRSHAPMTSRHDLAMTHWSMTSHHDVVSCCCNLSVSTNSSGSLSRHSVPFDSIPSTGNFMVHLGLSYSDDPGVFWYPDIPRLDLTELSLVPIEHSISRFCITKGMIFSSKCTIKRLAVGTAVTELRSSDPSWI